MRYETKYGHVEIYAQTVDNETVSQVIQMANSPLGEDAHIRVMPDCHAGKGCVIGTTMRITDKVCPNLVGVDIGCGVTMVATEDLHDRLDELDAVIRQHGTFGLTSTRLPIHTISPTWLAGISWTNAPRTFRSTV